MYCIICYLLAIVIPPTILMLVDAYIGYKKGGEELKGVSGFRRATIALTVLIILGVSIVHLLVNSSDEYKETIKNILSMLTGLVSGIAGFYFGGRFIEKRAEEAEKRLKEIEKIKSQQSNNQG